MKSLLLTVLIFFGSVASAQEADQRAEGQASEGLKWKVFFNFPECDHSDMGKKKGAWCTPQDSSSSARSNGVEAELVSWITDTNTKSLYLSYFSFSNKNIAAALCAETSKRPELNVTIYLDGGEAQIGKLESNIIELDEQLADPNDRRYIQGYQKGCLDRLNPRATVRGSGGFGGEGQYLQHAKIMLASDQPTLPARAGELQTWLTKSKSIRFSSSSSNMSSYGTTLHFENWIFFTAPPSNYIAQQNVCTMMAFQVATGDSSIQREQFKEAYARCEAAINVPFMRDLRYYVVPSLANNNGNGPDRALKDLIYNAHDNVKVSIHRLTTSAVSRPLQNKARQGVNVMMIQDDDTLRASVPNGGGAMDVDEWDKKNLCENTEAGIKVTFMETNGEANHIFHSKYVIADDRTVFQGAGNFTSSALNAWGNDGNYEQFYVIRIPELATAYSKAWTYLRSLSTAKEDHEVGNQPLQCNDNAFESMTPFENAITDLPENEDF